MTSVLAVPVDLLAAVVGEPVGLLPYEVASKVWLPLIAVALVTAMVLLFRKGVVLVSKSLDFMLRVVTTGVAVICLTVLMPPTVLWRARTNSVPSVISTADEFIATMADRISNGIGTVSTVFAKLQKLNIIWVVLLSALMFYTWNEDGCGADSVPCVKPVDAWISTMSE